MYSIPQKFINLSENILKNCLTQELSLIISPVLNNFLFYFDNHFLEFNLLDSIKKAIISSFSKAIKIIDNLFLNSFERKFSFYANKLVPRSITNLFGDLTFERYYYTDKNKKNGFFFIDELFKFEKYKTYSPELRASMIQASIITNSNLVSNNTSLFLNNFNYYMENNNSVNIPKQTIYYWIKNFDIPKVEYQCFDNVKNLYVMVDEKWIHEQIRKSSLSEEEKHKKHYIMSKCFVTFTGAKTKNNRKELINKHHFITSSNTSWKDFMDEIYNIYNFEEIENIYLLSDSGSWILAGKNELKLFKQNKVIVNTCEFHVKQYINRFVRDKEKRKELVKIIYEDKDKNEFTKVADEIIDNAKNKEKKIQYKNYILNHWKTILNMKGREIKSSMESHISHCIANIFGSRPKGYSKNNIEKYLKLQEYQLNDINIIDLYLKSLYQSNQLKYNEKEVNYSVFEKPTSPNIPRSLATALSR